MKLILIMSHFFFILIQIPYVILSLVCGISVVISNWNEYVANKQATTVYMMVESTGVEAQSDMDLMPMAA